MSKQETVEITIKVPKNAIDALREFVLKHNKETEEEYWARDIITSIIAEIDFICYHEPIGDGNPKPILEKYGLLKYYHDC